MSSNELPSREVTRRILPLHMRGWQSIDPVVRDGLSQWFALRLLTLVLLPVFAMLRPLTLSEQTIAIWPPSAPLGGWLARVVVAPWQRWDVHFYVRIVAQGYQRTDGTTQFHPLLSWLALPIGWLTGQPLLALLLVSSAASVLLVPAYVRLAQLDLTPHEVVASVRLLLLWPVAFILFAPYTESLWLLCAVLCFWCMRRRRWWYAGLAGGLATLTRQQGIFLALPLLWELWEASQRNWQRSLRQWHSWLSVGLIPVGLLIWMAYRAIVLGDLQANLSNPHTLIYSLIISPSASKVVPVQAFLWPWQALGLALQKLWVAPELSLIIDLTLAAIFVGLLVLAWPRMCFSYQLYTVAILLISFGYYTGPLYPYMGLPRHLLLAFPVFIGLSPRLCTPAKQRLYSVLGISGFCFLLLMYALESWTP